MTTTSSRSATVTLPTDEEILITREFDAPKHLVYRAYTEPDLVRRWWHARRGTMTVVEIDLRVGGAWRYAMVADGGQEVAFHGTYREIVPGSGSSRRRCTRACRSRSPARRSSTA